MKIENEWNLLNKIQGLIESNGLKNNPALVKAIGDDCSVFEINHEKYGLITTDISIENSHFISKRISPEDIGYKAMMGNISDIIAMGGTPLFAFVSLGTSANISEEFIEKIYRGMLDAANPAGVIIAGGDISKSGELVINIALYGDVKKNSVIKRSGAEDGDFIYLTGQTGDAMAGLEIFLSEKTELNNTEKCLLKSHLRPLAPFKHIKNISEYFKPTSMIDISDGILSDIRHICNESRCGFEIETNLLPISDELQLYSKLYKKDPIEYALNSGEEYQLLFTSKNEISLDYINIFENFQITKIGNIISTGFILNNNGKMTEAPVGGFNHFKGK